VGGLRLDEALWAANQDLARACLEHRFVRGLADGSLAAEAFRRYVAQDAFFLRAFVKAYAAALARADDREVAAELDAFIGGALEELKLHRACAAELDIDLERVAPGPACRAYTDFLLRVAWHAALSETVAAMAPCMRLYAWLGARLAGSARPENPYRRWIETYSSAQFQQLADRMGALLNRVAGDIAEVRDCYRYAMQCELDFFSEALG